MGNENAVLEEGADLAAILLEGRAFYTRKGGDVNVTDDMASPELRCAAALAMGASHNINYYPLLRQAAMTDADAGVRKAVRTASDMLEEEFGEEACLAADEAYTGGVQVKNSEEAHISGDFFNANLNDFR
ncbi:MAG: hypothetical protein ACI36W_05965 [Coriobacteriales bacterium]